MLIRGLELIGSRRPAAVVGGLDSDRLIMLWTKASSAVVKRGFKVIHDDLEAPRTGTFDGMRIIIDPDVDFEMQCFILLHLFGHSVQWVAPSLEEKLQDLQYTKDKERFLAVLEDYEHDSARYGLMLMREAGIEGLDQWYSDFVATDFRYVDTFYKTGKVPSWTDCIASGSELVEPLEIPELKHRTVEVRYAF